MPERFLARISQAEQLGWSAPEAVIDRVVAFTRIYLSGSEAFDEGRVRKLLVYDVARTANDASSHLNHFAMDTVDPVRDRLGEIAAPTLVIYGAGDTLFPLGLGEALAREIPGAQLLMLNSPAIC